MGLLTTALQLLPPEASHRLTLTAVARGWVPDQRQTDIRHTLFGCNLTSIVGLAAGADKNGVAIAGWQKLGFGFAELGTVTFAPRVGNPQPRLWRDRPRQALINYMGMPNDGYDKLAHRLSVFRQQELKRHRWELPRADHFCIGVSLAAPNGDLTQLAAMTKRLQGDADYFTLNVSCPNLADRQDLQSRFEGSLAQLSVMKVHTAKPVLVKLAPVDVDNEADCEDLKFAVKRLHNAGANGFIAANTLPAGPHTRWRQGGYSGPDLKPIGTKMVSLIRETLGAQPIVVGVGGIDGPGAAADYLAAGADAVQLYTALTYQGPGLVNRLNKALRL